MQLQSVQEVSSYSLSDPIVGLALVVVLFLAFAYMFSRE